MRPGLVARSRSSRRSGSSRAPPVDRQLPRLRNRRRYPPAPRGSGGVRLPDDLGVVVKEALATIDRLVGEAEDSADKAALACPTLSPETLEMLGDYLRSCLTGALAPSRVRNEARTWAELALTGW